MVVVRGLKHLVQAVELGVLHLGSTWFSSGTTHQHPWRPPALRATQMAPLSGTAPIAGQACSAREYLQRGASETEGKKKLWTSAQSLALRQRRASNPRSEIVTTVRFQQLGGAVVINQWSRGV